MLPRIRENRGEVIVKRRPGPDLPALKTNTSDMSNDLSCLNHRKRLKRLSLMTGRGGGERNADDMLLSGIGRWWIMGRKFMLYLIKHVNFREGRDDSFELTFHSFTDRMPGTYAFLCECGTCGSTLCHSVFM